MVLRIMGDAGDTGAAEGRSSEGVMEGLSDYQAMLETVPIANEVSDRCGEGHGRG